jgi:hypothetical protein
MNPFTQRTRGRAKLVTAGVTIGAVSAFMLPGPAASTALPTGQVAGGAMATVEQRVNAPGSLTSRVFGTFGSAGRVRGTFEPDRFFVRGGQAYANGVLRATLRRGNGQLVGSVTRRISIPVRSANNNALATPARRVECDVLNLVLGPLDLNLLGLEVHLNRVVLNIVAVTGAGNLLGNLLCAVVGLLDGTGLLNELRLANVLNRILAILRLG